MVTDAPETLVMDGTARGQHGNEPIAIVGMGCRLPGGISSAADLWKLLIEGRSGLKDFPPSRLNLDGFYHPDPQRPGSFHTRGACLIDEDPTLFDHAFFDMTSKQTATLDPNQRQLLEVTYECLENAGEPWHKFSGSRTGVFVGNMGTDHGIVQTYNADYCLPQSSTGGSTSILSNRINHIFNLRGPSLTVDTACSSSMYALHLAVTAINHGDCDAAIVGGCNLILAPEMQIMTAKMGALSASSACHTFDASADGYGRGEGFVALYIRRYSDARQNGYPVQAVIRGTAVNSNGRTAGISHPSPEGQEAVIRQAYKNAGLPTSVTGYFECHGTGTPVGDPIEVSAIGRVFASERNASSPLLIGSVKTNLGHTEAASGLVGIMKAVLALEKGIIPATLGVQHLNPNVNFAGAHVKVVTEPTRWPADTLRRASVNSFGYGGANGHCVLEHQSVLNKIDRDPKHSTEAPPASGVVLLPFSAKHPASLQLNMEKADEMIRAHSPVEVAHTLWRHRSTFRHRGYCIVDQRHSGQDLRITQNEPSVQSGGNKPSVNFVFTGQGAQWKGMGAGLMEFPTFRKSILHQTEVLQSLQHPPSWSLTSFFEDHFELSVDNPEVAQTICTALQIALVDLLHTLDITPVACVGHSSGEIAAAYASGFISSAEAIVTAYCRGKAVSQVKTSGSMLAVGMSLEAITARMGSLHQQVRIAAVNSPGSVTLSGDTLAIDEVQTLLAGENVFTRVLKTGGKAYHSHHMDEPGEVYDQLLRAELAVVSGRRCSASRSATWISSVHPDQAMVPDQELTTYWRQNLLSPVLFSEAVTKLFAQNDAKPDVLIEVGPHSALRSPLQEVSNAVKSPVRPAPAYFSVLKRNGNAAFDLTELCGNLFCYNYPVNIDSLNTRGCVNDANLNTVSTELPPYQFHYEAPIYHQSRLFREVKDRKYLRHDILGVLQPGCAKEYPSWRNILRLKDVPWLGDHRLLPNPVLPGAAYILLAIEALTQHLDSKTVGHCTGRFRLRNVSIKAAMQIPEDDNGLETVLSLHPVSSSSDWYAFSISSTPVDHTSWTEHAAGNISFGPAARPQASFSELTVPMDPRVIEPEDWYECFTNAGLGYGPSFRGLSRLLCDPRKNLASADVALATTAGLFEGPESRYHVHPATLDISFQLALIASYGGQTERFRSAFVPVSIEEMSVWPTDSGQVTGHGVARAKFAGMRALHADISLFDSAYAPVVEVKNMRCVTHAGGEIQKRTYTEVASPYARLVWKPDISTLSNEQAQRLFPPIVKAEEVQHTLESMVELSQWMIVDIAERFQDFNPNQAHLRRFLGWARRYATIDDPVIDSAKLQSQQDRSSTINHLAKLLRDVPDVKYLRRIFDNLDYILSEDASAFQIATEGDSLNDVYAHGLGISAAYSQLERMIDLMAHRNPSMKIIEIGAGTGAATEIALKALTQDNGTKKYQQFVFTDVSSAFLEPAKLRFSGFRNVTYSTLDFNRPVQNQGFASEYDLVIASECLHTAKDLNLALRNIRSLLKPGGRLVMIESTRTLPGHGIAFGTFADWWPEDIKLDSPFRESHQWHKALKHSYFSGVDIELYDYPHPVSIASTMVATALPFPETNGVHETDKDVVYIIYDEATDLHSGLEKAITMSRLHPVLTTLEACQIEVGSRVILSTNIGHDPLLNGSERHFKKIQEVVSKSSSILWLTDGDVLRGGHPQAAIITGLVRMLITEETLKRFGVFHLEKGFDPSNASLLSAVVERETRIAEGDFEREIAMHNGVAHIGRLLTDAGLSKRYRQMYSPNPVLEEKTMNNLAPSRLRFSSARLISSNYFEPKQDVGIELPDDYIEVKTEAIGLDENSVSSLLSKIDADHLGMQFSGKVIRRGKKIKGFQLGDVVYGLTAHDYENVIRVDAGRVHHVPASVDSTTASTVPVAFVNAAYALNHLARLRKSDRILIETECESFGLAAMQLAGRIGADVSVAVNTEDQAYLLSHLQSKLPKHRVFSPNVPAVDSSFDVILSINNTANREMNWSRLRKRGRLVYVRRPDSNDYSSALVSSCDATVSSFNFDELIAEEPDFANRLVDEVDRAIKEGFIRPVVCQATFGIAELGKAVSALTTRQSLGPIAVAYADDSAPLKVSELRPHITFKSNAVYVVVGGLGALGRSIVQWMIDRGARNIAVFNRSGTASAEALKLIEDLAKEQTAIRILKCDVTNRDEVEHAIKEAAEQGPILGILHAAVVLQDHVFSTLSHAQWNVGLAAKVQGTLNLHNVAGDMHLDLDFFIMTSSFEAVMALPTQASYCAANCFQDAFARYRRAQGLPGCAIAFGLITEVGEVGQRSLVRNMIHRNGLYRTGELGFLRLLESAFLDPPSPPGNWRGFDPLVDAQITTCIEPGLLAKEAGKGYDERTKPRWHSDKKFSHILQAMTDHLAGQEPASQTKPKVSAITADFDRAIADGNFGSAERLVSQAISERVARLLNLTMEGLDAGISIAHYGVDSLIAVELRNWFGLTFNDNLPLLMLLDESVSIRALASTVVRNRMAGSAGS